VDLHFFARGREATFRESVIWSIGWLALGLSMTAVVLVAQGGDDAVNYVTVYLIERSLSLDNLFVFILLFTYFAVPHQYRAGMLFSGIIAALVLRGLAIAGGTVLIEQFQFVLYILGVLLLVLAYRIFKGVSENIDPDRNLVVRGVRKLFPVSAEMGAGEYVRTENGVRKVTPIFLCLAAIVAADIAFAVDSIPAAFAITQEAPIIWTANVFALMGLRALFVLVEGLMRRFRYLDETIAIVLGLVGIKILIEDLVKIGPAASLGIVAFAFAVGTGVSLIADRRDPGGAKQRQREMGEPHGGPPTPPGAEHHEEPART